MGCCCGIGLWVLICLCLLGVCHALRVVTCEFGFACGGVLCLYLVAYLRVGLGVSLLLVWLNVVAWIWWVALLWVLRWS